MEFISNMPRFSVNVCARCFTRVCNLVASLASLVDFLIIFNVKQKKVHKERSIQVNEVNRDRISTFAYVREKQMLLAPVHISNSDV